jgi:hypothetical protein
MASDPVALQTLRIALEAADLVETLRNEIAKTGPMIMGARGLLIANPLLSAARDARSAYLQAVKSLGLAPITGPGKLSLED